MTLAEYREKRGEPIIPEDEGHESHHPSAFQYLQVGALLTAITAVEVGIYYIDMSHDLLVALLIMLSAVKFTFVVAWFMHLRFDSKLFTLAFVTGLVTAFSVFTVVIVALHGGLV